MITMKKKSFIKRVKWSNVFWLIANVISICMGIWLFASWVDTNAHNNPFENDYGQFAEWNAFVNIVNEYE